MGPEGCVPTWVPTEAPQALQKQHSGVPQGQPAVGRSTGPPPWALTGQVATVGRLGRAAGRTARTPLDAPPESSSTAKSASPLTPATATEPRRGARAGPTELTLLASSPAWRSEISLPAERGRLHARQSPAVGGGSGPPLRRAPPAPLPSATWPFFSSHRLRIRAATWRKPRPSAKVASRSPRIPADTRALLSSLSRKAVRGRGSMVPEFDAPWVPGSRPNDLRHRDRDRAAGPSAIVKEVGVRCRAPAESAPVVAPGGSLSAVVVPAASITSPRRGCRLGRAPPLDPARGARRLRADDRHVPHWSYARPRGVFRWSPKGVPPRLLPAARKGRRSQPISTRSAPGNPARHSNRAYPRASNSFGHQQQALVKGRARYLLPPLQPLEEGLAGPLGRVGLAKRRGRAAATPNARQTEPAIPLRAPSARTRAENLATVPKTRRRAQARGMPSCPAAQS